MPLPATLTTRERQVIEQVTRDRIASNETLHRRFFEGLHASSVTRVTSRLVKQGWLRAYPLIYPCKYYLPGKRAVAAYGLPNARSLPLGPQSLPTEYALLEYTSKHADTTRRLTIEEIVDAFPWYRAEWLFAPHCQRTAEGKTILELIRVDLGGPAAHIARKCRDDIELRRVEPGFLELLQSGRFSLVVITGTTSKAAAIQAALDKHIWPTGTAFRLATFVSLIPLLPRSL